MVCALGFCACQHSGQPPRTRPWSLRFIFQSQWAHANQKPSGICFRSLTSELAMISAKRRPSLESALTAPSHAKIRYPTNFPQIPTSKITQAYLRPTLAKSVYPSLEDSFLCANRSTATARGVSNDLSGAHCRRYDSRHWNLYDSSESIIHSNRPEKPLDSSRLCLVIEGIAFECEPAAVEILAHVLSGASIRRSPVAIISCATTKQYTGSPSKRTIVLQGHLSMFTPRRVNMGPQKQYSPNHS